ncbi:hypothetical protein V6N11_004093 [Hibiscus sabdariffa]|uniref:Uncharacterized protein n=1 Tax=Hibiscus sabdariffa TaxID=183260 RepID=A0ABR2SF58_9ROSI
MSCGWLQQPMSLGAPKIHLRLSGIFRLGNGRSDAEVEKLRIVIEKYSLANHMFWGLWGIISIGFSAHHLFP